jgi:hypothetical protein
VDSETKQLLARWRSLESGDGLRAALSTSRVLLLVGLALCLFVVFAIVYKFHPVAIAFAATAMGWVIAERNALRSRVSQWPIFRKYIDWKRVSEDSHHDA